MTFNPIELLEGRWTLQILICLAQGPRRFSDLRTAVPGISGNLLTARLRMLEDRGLVQRRYLPPPAARMVYEFETNARHLQAALLALNDWSHTESSGVPTAQKRRTVDTKQPTSRKQKP